MKRIFVGIVCVGVVCLCFWFKWQSDEPRRTSVKAFQQFTADFASGDARILDRIVMPAGVRDRTSAEQFEFIRKSLQDEISPEGFEVLKKHASYGPLKLLFPSEAVAWTKQAGVKAEDCIAFRLERNGIRAEVVLVHEGEIFRVVRCNNVKQMAVAKL